MSAAAGAAPPVEITFTANSYSNIADAATTLSWSVLNATSVSINQGIGNVAATGSTSQTGNGVTRTYTLTAVGLNGMTYTSSLSISWNSCPWGPPWDKYFC